MEREGRTGIEVIASNLWHIYIILNNNIPYDMILILEKRWGVVTTRNHHYILYLYIISYYIPIYIIFRGGGRGIIHYI